MLVHEKIRIVPEETKFRLPAAFDLTATDHLLSLTHILFRMPVVLELNNGYEKVMRYTGIGKDDELPDQLIAQIPGAFRQEKNLPPNCSVSLLENGPYSFLVQIRLVSAADEIGTLYLADKRSHRFNKDRKTVLGRLAEIFTETIEKNSTEAAQNPLSSITAGMAWFYKT